jgi:hypothetical protein
VRHSYINHTMVPSCMTEHPPGPSSSIIFRDAYSFIAIQLPQLQRVCGIIDAEHPLQPESSCQQCQKAQGSARRNTVGSASLPNFQCPCEHHRRHQSVSARPGKHAVCLAHSVRRRWNSYGSNGFQCFHSTAAHKSGHRTMSAYSSFSAAAEFTTHLTGSAKSRCRWLLAVCATLSTTVQQSPSKQAQTAGER